MLDNWILNTYTTILATLLGAIGFLIRKIFTSEKKIEILESRLNMIDDLEEDIRELRTDVKDILFHMSRV